MIIKTRSLSKWQRRSIRTLDKKQDSFKQIRSNGAVKQDLVISAYKPKDSFVKEMTTNAGTDETAWAFVRQHLSNLPVVVDADRDGKIDILISTTVIEVGVNVPNSSIMVVENAERFGLAQLHQLRGRVGRGEYQSYCILKYEGNSETIRERMKVMVDTNDGFVISEKDLELRGSGDFFGTEQHGLPAFKVANLFTDMPILKAVQSLAIRILTEDPKLEREENKPLKYLIKDKFKERIEI